MILTKKNLENENTVPFLGHKTETVARIEVCFFLLEPAFDKIKLFGFEIFQNRALKPLKTSLNTLISNIQVCCFSGHPILKKIITRKPQIGLSSIFFCQNRLSKIYKCYVLTKIKFCPQIIQNGPRMDYILKFQISGQVVNCLFAYFYD